MHWTDWTMDTAGLRFLGCLWNFHMNLGNVGYVSMATLFKGGFPYSLVYRTWGFEGAQATYYCDRDYKQYQFRN